MLGSPTLTLKGRNLLAKIVAANRPLTLSNIGLGDGLQEENESVTTLVNEIMKKEIESCKYNENEGQYYVRRVFTNEELDEGFYIREVGIYAIDPDEGEILYAYTNGGENGVDYFAPGTGKVIIKEIIEMATRFGNAEEINITIDPSVALVTNKEFEEYKKTNKEDINNLQEQIDENTAQLKDLANLNLFINGGFSVWQRGTSFSTNGYTADRWMYDVEGDDKGKIVRHANGGVQIKLISNKRFWFMQRIELNQELKNIFSNSTVTLSFYVTTSAGVKISPYIRVWSPSRNANIFLKSYEAKATRQLIECQITLGDLSSDDWLGIDIFRIEEDNKFTVGDDLYIRFENAKLELGTKATPFVPRPYGEELALCQRYYISDSFSFRESVPTTTVWDKFIPIRPYMRIVPTINASMYNTNDQNTLLDNIKFSVYRGNNLNFWSDIQMLEAGVQYSVYYSLDAEIY